MLKKNSAIALYATLAAGFGTVAAGANAAGTGLDFSAITGAIDASTIVAAISAIAAIKILPGVAKWGYNKVIGWFGG
ncbi:hypothetical protein [Silvimonas soli]|uniref:hypothetical protein n=1 Tax=Silvimonas soli TaxID=2980100 RepID=UPI0024B32E88|nr:hypothetical protein [Silvimonas soli]